MRTLGPFDEPENHTTDAGNPFAEPQISNPFLDETVEQITEPQVCLSPVHLGGGDSSRKELPPKLTLAGVLTTESLPTSHPMSILPHPDSGEVKKDIKIHEKTEEPQDMIRSFRFKDPKVDQIEYHTPATRQHEGEQQPFRKSTEQPVEDIQQEHFVRGLLQINQTGKCITILRLEGVLEVNAGNCCIIIQENLGLVDLRGSNNVLRITRKDKLGILKNRGKNNIFQSAIIQPGWQHPKPIFEGVNISYRNHYCEIPPPDPADVPKQIVYSPVISQVSSLAVSRVVPNQTTNPFAGYPPTQKQATRMASSELQDHNIQPLPGIRRDEQVQEPKEMDMVQGSGKKVKTPFDQDSSDEQPQTAINKPVSKKRSSLLVPHLQFTTGNHTVELVKKSEQVKEPRPQTVETGSQELHKQSVEEKQRNDPASKLTAVPEFPKYSELERSQELTDKHIAQTNQTAGFSRTEAQQNPNKVQHKGNQEKPPQPRESQAKPALLGGNPQHARPAPPNHNHGIKAAPSSLHNPLSAQPQRSVHRHIWPAEGNMLDDQEEMFRLQRYFTEQDLGAPYGQRHPKNKASRGQRLARPQIEAAFENEEKKKVRKIKTVEGVGGTISIMHDCPICYEEFDKTEFGASYLDCGHWFHFKCLEPWFKKNDTCPECKAQVEVNTMILPCKK